MLPEFSGVWYGLGVVTGTGTSLVAFLTYLLRRRTQKTKLVVEVSMYRSLSDGLLEALTLAVRIVNHSHFDVTLSYIGLRIRNNWYSRRQRVAVKPWVDADRTNSIPFRLLARDEQIFVLTIAKKSWLINWGVPTIETVLKATDVFVETSTENRFYGRGNDLKAFIKAIREEDLTKLTHWDK